MQCKVLLFPFWKREIRRSCSRFRTCVTTKEKAPVGLFQFLSTKEEINESLSRNGKSSIYTKRNETNPFWIQPNANYIVIVAKKGCKCTAAILKGLFPSAVLNCSNGSLLIWFWPSSTLNKRRLEFGDETWDSLSCVFFCFSFRSWNIATISMGSGTLVKSEPFFPDTTSCRTWPSRSSSRPEVSLPISPIYLSQLFTNRHITPIETLGKSWIKRNLTSHLSPFIWSILPIYQHLSHSQ